MNTDQHVRNMRYVAVKHDVSMETCSFHVLTQTSGVFSKRYNLEDEIVT